MTPPQHYCPSTMWVSWMRVGTKRVVLWGFTWTDFYSSDLSNNLYDLPFPRPFLIAFATPSFFLFILVSLLPSFPPQIDWCQFGTWFTQARTFSCNFLGFRRFSRLVGLIVIISSIVSFHIWISFRMLLLVSWRSTRFWSHQRTLTSILLLFAISFSPIRCLPLAIKIKGVWWVRSQTCHVWAFVLLHSSLFDWWTLRAGLISSYGRGGSNKRMTRSWIWSKSGGLIPKLYEKATGQCRIVLQLL